jgi:hypothetical protein
MSNPKGRVTKYVNLNDAYKYYVTNDITLKHLSDKFLIPTTVLHYHSVKYNWGKDKKEYYNRVMEKKVEIQAQQENATKFNLIAAIDKIIELKSDSETRALLLGQSEGTIKALTLVLNKSKDSITDLSKLKELLTGNVTDRVGLTNLDGVDDSSSLTQLARRAIGNRLQSIPPAAGTG